MNQLIKANTLDSEESRTLGGFSMKGKDANKNKNHLDSKKWNQPYKKDNLADTENTHINKLRSSVSQ